jgi:HlyD family type I secretion membrane fusion protein
MIVAAKENPGLARRALAEELARPATRSVRTSGFVAAVLFVALLGLSVFVPIASGTLAMGQIAVEGERKVLQHASGGIVAEILVREGDAVKQNDIVLRLNAVQAGAAAGVLNAQVDALRAEEAVRMAEATGVASVTFPAELLERREDPSVNAILTAESAAFDARNALARSEVEQLNQQLVQIDKSILSARAGRTTQQRQANLYEQELGALRPLMEKGLSVRYRLLDIERAAEGARGEVESLGSEIKRLEARAAETRGLRDRIDVDRRAEAAEALRTLRASLGELLDRQLAADDTLQRTDMRAPIDGVVMAMRVNTIGGVVEPGQPLLEIVPQSDLLVARVRILPSDADNVRQGMSATVRLAAGGRKPVQLEGSVQSISADALTDNRSGESYFEARIAIPHDDTTPREVLAPGLPAEVLIKTGEHTILDYLFSPIERAVFQSMRDT